MSPFVATHSQSTETAVWGYTVDFRAFDVFACWTRSQALMWSAKHHKQYGIHTTHARPVEKRIVVIVCVCVLVFNVPD